MTEPLHRIPTEARPRCSSVSIVLNGGKKQQEIAASLQTAFAEAGCPMTLFTCRPGQPFSSLIGEAVAQAAESGGLLVAAGGDGTVNAVAAVAAERGIALGILPLGTFNYFAREHGIPVTLPEAIATLLEGVEKRVAVGYAGERLFLNNASFGLYSTLIRKREEATSRFGRIRAIAALSAMLSVLRGHRSFSVRLDVDGEGQTHRTSLVFVGNNTLQLQKLGLRAADYVARDALAVIIMKSTSRYENLRILFRSLTRTLGDEMRLEEFPAEHVTVQSRRPRIDLVVDGEIVRASVPLTFRIARDALTLIAPREAA